MKNKLPLQTRVMQALNRAGISDMNGDLYDTHGPNVVRFVLRKARAEFKAPAKAGLVRRFFCNPLDLKWSGTALLRLFKEQNTSETQAAITPVLVVRDTPAARQALGFKQD